MHFLVWRFTAEGLIVDLWHRLLIGKHYWKNVMNRAFFSEAVSTSSCCCNRKKKREFPCVMHLWFECSNKRFCKILPIMYGPGIDSRWCHLGFFRGSFRQNHVPWGRLSLWKWVPGISSGVKVAGAFGWRPTTLVVPKVEKIRGLNLPGTPRATSACRGMPLLYFINNVDTEAKEHQTRFM
jgi:hypothetical protein